MKKLSELKLFTEKPANETDDDDWFFIGDAGNCSLHPLLYCISLN